MIMILAVAGCKKEQKNNNSVVQNNNNLYDIKYEFKTNATNLSKTSDVLNFEINITDTIKTDSIAFVLDNKKIQNIEKNFVYNLETKQMSVGRHELKFILYTKQKEYTISKQFVLLSDIEPQKKRYKLIKSYPHDVGAYTQGLIYHNGYLLESTGLETKSSIRKVNISNGEVINSINLPDKYFGEGIALLGNNLYMLTWRDHTALLIDINTFEIKNTFNYTTEGWGLATDDNLLFMSDGSNYIYIVDPANFETINKIAVYTNQAPVNYLNELEFINGILYANVYREDYIVGIDPKTGKVLEIIDCKGILPQNMYTEKTDVLNGIAYNYSKKTIYITGKNWPLLFEVIFE